MAKESGEPQNISEPATAKNAWREVFRNDGEVFPKPLEDMLKVEKMFEERGVKKVLDLGCGSGRHTVYLAEHGFDVSGIDDAQEGIEITKTKLEAKKLKADLKLGDIYEKLPYQDGSFDAIVSTQTMHHNKIEKIRELIKEMERVLTPGGMIFITVRRRENPNEGNGADEEKLADRTFAPLSGGEQGLPHYYFDEETLRREFSDFEIESIWEEIGGKHWCLLGKLKNAIREAE